MMFMKVLALLSFCTLALASASLDGDLADLRTFTTPLKLLSEKIAVAAAPAPEANGFSLLETKTTFKVIETPEIAESIVDQQAMKVLHDMDTMTTNVAEEDTTNEEDDMNTSIFFEEASFIEKKGLKSAVAEEVATTDTPAAQKPDLLTLDPKNSAYWLPGAWGTAPSQPLSTMYFTPSARNTPDTPLLVTNPYYSSPAGIPNAMPPITSAQEKNFDTNPATLNMNGVDTLQWTKANSVTPIASVIGGTPAIGQYVTPAWLEVDSEISKRRRSRIVKSITKTFVDSDEESLKETVFQKKNGLTYRTSVSDSVPLFSGSKYVEALYSSKPNVNDRFGTFDLSPANKLKLLFAKRQVARKAQKFIPSLHGTPKGLKGLPEPETTHVETKGPLGKLIQNSKNLLYAPKIRK